MNADGTPTNWTPTATPNFPTVESQLTQCRRWAQLFREFGYEVMFTYTGERGRPQGYDKEWQVWTLHGVRVGSIDIDGSGASWHGDEQTWLDVIGASEGVTN